MVLPFLWMAGQIISRRTPRQLETLSTARISDDMGYFPRPNVVTPPTMNYRHAFHAGGFADVIKHIVLVRMLTYLQEKQAPFRVIATHAGAERYDLAGEEARRGGEWLTGIARVLQAWFSENALPLVAPYLDMLRAFKVPGKLEAYPGSPLIVRAL